MGRGKGRVSGVHACKDGITRAPAAIGGGPADPERTAGGKTKPQIEAKDCRWNNHNPAFTTRHGQAAEEVCKERQDWQDDLFPQGNAYLRHHLALQWCGHLHHFTAPWARGHSDHTDLRTGNR